MVAGQDHPFPSQAVTEAEQLTARIDHLADELERLAEEVQLAARRRVEREGPPDA